MKQLEVCLTPDLLQHYSLEGKVVVVIDVFRATTTMVSALANGISRITPVATLKECSALKEKGYLTAAERNGKKPGGFDLGNSPLNYLKHDYSGQQLAMTTSNGTLAITKSIAAHEIIIGAFINMSAVVAYLRAQSQDILLLCAGWKGRINTEDSLFAGAVAHLLANETELANDSAVAVQSLYQTHETNMEEFLKEGLHFNRLQRLGLDEDIEFCLKKDEYNLVPTYKNGVLIGVVYHPQ
ncbi:2-phosphosulfolactate phosphatase [Microscilla marina]|uniref:Probable 2-phosphosulfolactate phosphatase n=1 Tax=Microscilla marina ATCC 23134 TaxID=313606 RepID=A1ZHL1_MICM2|nr:2-phosphosulfolactate phosphatase [Microscilla marina]EAY30018.1 2-phosphosulfolactate phosphatase [Microscilla marina ATCC 23134]